MGVILPSVKTEVNFFLEDGKRKMVQESFRKVISALGLNESQFFVDETDISCRSGPPPNEYIEKCNVVLNSSDPRLVKDFKKEILYFYEESKRKQEDKRMFNPSQDDPESLIDPRPKSTVG